MTSCGPRHDAPRDGSCPCGRVSRHPAATPMLAGDEVIVAALAEALFACVSPETKGDEEDWDGAREIGRGLLPTVRRVAEQRAAAELLAAANAVQRWGTETDTANAKHLRARAAALTATPNHGRNAT